ncbi:MAG: GAF domain-containing protein, partial [Novibacillus thermophilus]
MNEIIKENETFIQHTVRILEKLAPYIRQSGHIATLVSKDGTIVHTAGDPSFEEQARTVHLQVGTNWQERRKGTNAMGVALVEQKPVRVHGGQHFYVKNRFLTCAASPVFTPRGELAGVINMSGRKERFNPLTLSLVSMVAETLQSRLLLEEAQHEHVLTVRELERTVDFTPFPLVSLDHERRIIRANQAARRLLGQDCIGKEFKEKKG